MLLLVSRDLLVLQMFHYNVNLLSFNVTLSILLVRC